ncbi:MAG TPA: LamG-like jellyroll fold domain-containing protein, partial [Thermoleophilia bacterium]|nr:LamG-like jellyroll fold domain-containing protein [Thermoleophilia bacterium]
MVAAAVAPSNTSPPSISGTTAAGETLTADPGVWSGDPQITYTYQWQRCSAGSCAAISGATAQTYETISNDAGSTLEVSVTGSNPGGSQTLTSTATAAITAVSAPVATVAPSISGQAVQGGTLTANTGSWTGSGLSYAYQWETCGDYRSTVITDAPAGYWRLGESSGSAIADSSGNNLAGSLTGGVTLGQPGVVAGDGDTAISFDGSSGYASIADAPSLSFTGGSFTVEAWVKTTSAAMVPLVSKSSGSSTREYSLRLAAGGTPVFAVYSGGQTESAVSGPTAINDGHWHQVVGVASTSSGTTTLTVYVDGAPAGLTSTSGLTFTDTTAPLEIGRFNSPPDTTAYAAATIDEAAVYPTALSATRVQAHYAAAACSPISGATDSSYSVTASDAGFVRVAVTAANSVGSSTATSAGVGPIQGATPPVNVTPPWFTGNPVAGQTLDGFPGDWLGSAPINYGYQWQRCTTYEGTVQADAPTDWWKLQETTGSSAADSGAGGITAPYMSSPTLGAAGAVSSCGSSNTGVSFDGASQYVQLPQTVQFDSGNFSVEGWFKASTITDTNGAALWSSGYDGIAGSYVLVELSQNSGHPVGTLDFVASDAANDYVHVWSPSTYLDGRWHYFAATRNGSNFTLYVDGAPVGSASAAVGDVDSTGTYPEIGAFERGTGLNTSDPRHFNGSLDEIAVYKTALSASQVNAHFNAASQ